MTRIISVHSWRGGTGKSNLTANLAALLAAAGQRVAVVDTDIQSPGLHILFGLKGAAIRHSLNDYLWGRAPIEEAAIDVSEALGVPVAGKLFLVPSSINSGEIARVLREGCDARALTGGLRKLARALSLDALLIDTHPGLNEETLLSIALSHTLVIILRPDQQDYEGTGVTLEVAGALNVPKMLLVVNKVPALFDADDVREQVAQAYGRPVAAVIPHSDEMMALASGGIFALRYPDHPIAATMREVAQSLAAEEVAND
ncbi:MAG: MinD/ParA family protein [Chloroflexales bacterium]|nr:MinD/ParA family protein [Chloroflexales bacterium]